MAARPKTPPLSGQSGPQMPEPHHSAGKGPAPPAATPHGVQNMGPVAVMKAYRADSSGKARRCNC